MCIYIIQYVCIHMDEYMRVCLYLYTCMQIEMYVYIYKYLHKYTHISHKYGPHVCASIYACTYVCIYVLYIYIYVHVHMQVHTYIYLYIYIRAQRINRPAGVVSCEGATMLRTARRDTTKRREGTRKRGELGVQASRR